VLVQESWVEWPDVYDRVDNILRSRLMGADVRLVRAEFGIGFKGSWERALRDIEEAGEHHLTHAQLEGFRRRDGGRRGGLGWR
jgi:1-aminocyclopropane-1-carboxylate deaminase/D-cysteine desulfhydrase-like pyridoxal-dependent ACC family enzyme